MPRATPRPRQRGVTLIELMVTVAIVAVLLAVAAPSFKSASLSNKLSSYANSFVASTQFARSEAVKRRAVVRMCRSANGASCAGSGTWAQGWIVYHDANNDASVSAGESVLQTSKAISDDYAFSGSGYDLAFMPSGTGSTAATATLCKIGEESGTQARAIQVLATGRISIAKTTAATCS